MLTRMQYTPGIQKSCAYVLGFGICPPYGTFRVIWYCEDPPYPEGGFQLHLKAEAAHRSIGRDLPGQHGHGIRQCRRYPRPGLRPCNEAALLEG